MRRVLAVAILIVAGPAVGQDNTIQTEPAPSVDSHVVEAGDTLWDITARVFGNPFLWPKVWSYNPEITNPHWIYPGDIIRFYPSEVPLPSQTELIANNMEMPEDGPEEYEPPEAPASPAIEVIETMPRRRSTVGSVDRFVGLFVTPKELEEAGILTNSAEDKMLFATHDLVFISFSSEHQPEPGQKYMVFRTLGEVIHPTQHRRWGYMTQITGLVTIESVESGVAKAHLDQSVVEVERGQYVAPLIPGLTAHVKPKSAANQVEGVVLAVLFDGGEIAGEQQVVFVDKGTKDGLEKGTLLSVATRGDPLTGEGEKLPFQQTARLVVVQAGETASTCLVMDSRREIEPGASVFSSM